MKVEHNLFYYGRTLKFICESSVGQSMELFNNNLNRNDNLYYIINIKLLLFTTRCNDKKKYHHNIEKYK